MADSQCDVLIIGAGMAGACLARQLRLELPELSVIQIDKKETFDYWIGESTTEPWHDYAVRVLKLGPYLMQNHVRKNGFRFFWDSEAKDLPVPEMSECGHNAYAPVLTAWQLDRATFDRDMARMNRELGVDVRLGVGVASDRGADEPAIQIDGEGGHTVRTTDGVIRCKWLVDAGGRSAPLVRKLGLVDPEETLPTSSFWARYEGCRSIDELGDDAWHRRVNFTLRHGSTQHFFYDGYWIWFIPLHSGVISIGVSFDTRQHQMSFRNAEELTAFFRTHRCLDDLLGDRAAPLDFIGFKTLSRFAGQHFSDDRWFLTGMSGLVVDPFLSQSSVFHTISNRFITELIRADRAGDRDVVRGRLPACNSVMTGLWRAWQRRIRDERLFHQFASFEVTAPLLHATHIWMYAFLMPMMTADWKPFFEQVDAMRFMDPETAAMMMANVDRFNGTKHVEAIERVNVEFSAWLDSRGRYLEKNSGEFLQSGPGGSARMPVIMRVYQPMPMHEALPWSLAEGDVTYRWMFADRLQRMCRVEGVAWREGTFDRVFDPSIDAMQTLGDAFAQYRRVLAEKAS